MPPPAEAVQKRHYSPYWSLWFRLQGLIGGSKDPALQTVVKAIAQL